MCCSIASEEHAASGGRETSGFEALRERADALRATIVQVRRRNALSDKTINELGPVCFNILTHATHDSPRQARDVKTQQITLCRNPLAQSKAEYDALEPVLQATLSMSTVRRIPR